MQDINNNLFFNTLDRSSFKKSTLIFYFLWPIAGLYLALSNYRNEWSKNIFWLFCIFFGYCFIIGGTNSTDSYYYAQVFSQYTNSKLSLKELLSSFYSESSNYVDMASPLITFLVAQITNNPRILFVVFGLIFGYFYSRNIWLVLDHIEGNLSKVVLIFIFAFSLLNPIWNINGFRMWTAAHLFLFGTLPFLLEGNKKRLYWSVVSVFFHFSFMAPVAILFLFIFLRNRLNIYMGFFVLTIFIKELDLNVVRSALSFLPDVFQSRVSGYTNLDYAETIKMMGQSLNWYITVSANVIQWISYLFALFIYLFCRQVLKSRSDLLTLFCFSIFLFGFANIASQMPAGGRFIMVANMFMFSFLAIFISTFPRIKYLPLVNTISIPFLLLFIAVSVREGMDFFGLTTIIGNPFTVVFYSDSVPFITGIKELLP